MTPTKLLKHGKRSVALAFTLAGALLLGACGSAAGAVELESAQAQLTAAQAELNTLLYALQSVEQIEVPEAEEADPVMEISRTESDLVGIWDNPDIPTIRVVLSPDGTGATNLTRMAVGRLTQPGSGMLTVLSPITMTAACGRLAP